MNPEAIRWLEGLSESARTHIFQPAYPYDGNLFSFKHDHEAAKSGRCLTCFTAVQAGELVVIE